MYTCVRSCPRVASAAGSGSASMPVASAAGSGSASMPVASAAGSGSASMPVASAAGSGSASMPVASAAGSGSASMRLGSGQWICVLPAAVGHPRVQIPLDLRAWPAAGARQRGQNSAILPALPRQRVVDLHLCPSSWKRAVDLRTARCMLLDTPVLYGKCVPITRTRRSTRCSTTFIPPHCPRRSTRWGTQTSFTPRGPAAWHCARLWIRTLPGP